MVFYVSGDVARIGTAEPSRGRESLNKLRSSGQS